MIKLIPALFGLILSMTSVAQYDSIVYKYIDNYKSIAIEEMVRTHIPAAITLAQGIIEAGAGKSELVLKSNNHFGIKCKSTWVGEKVYYNDDIQGECFRKYTSAIESFKDHSNFLNANTRYAFLFTIDPTDYTNWAYGLKQAGYATDPKYAQLIIQCIEKYRLQDYTLLALAIIQQSKEQSNLSKN